MSSREGLRAASWSLLVLLITTLLQLGVFVLTGSVALLAGLIHNFGDALTAVPLGIAFLLRSFKAEKRADEDRRDTPRRSAPAPASGSTARP